MSDGRVQTVLGDVSPSSLGITLTHEHVLVSAGRRRKGSAARQYVGSRDPRASDSITLESVGWVRRNWASHVDNMHLDEEDVAIAELGRYRDAGGNTIVDATNSDLSRHPTKLASISKASGVRIIMGSGHYTEKAHPPDMDRRSEDKLMEEIVRDVQEGCDDTGIKAGVIGEIGCSAPMTPNERKSLRAAARAQRQTEAALLIHPGRATGAPAEAMAIAMEAGADPAKIIMSHVERTLFELRDMITLAETGCYLEFDLFGQESSYYPLAPIDLPNDATRINYLQRLMAEGYELRLLVSQDICRKTSLVKYGGEGYGHILEDVVPVMRRKGMTEAEIESILTRHPARVLTIA